MEEFRRFIVSIIGTLEVLFVVAATLICGIIGGALPALIGGGRAGLLGFLIGGAAGFCLSGIIVNISMSLAEIAKNTQPAENRSEQASDEAATRGDLHPESVDLTPEEKEEARRLLESRGIRVRDG